MVAEATEPVYFEALTPSGLPVPQIEDYSMKEHPRDANGRLLPTGRTPLTPAERQRRYRAKDPERARAQSRKHNAERREWCGDEIRAYDRERGKNKARDKAKEKARKLAWDHVEPQPCEVCGNPKADRHHDDYNKPLEVRFLCKKHHGEVHRIAA